MASSEVDQKALGNFAAVTSHENPFLSAMLYKTLGLSVMLSRKLLRARRLRRLDPTRETKSLQLYHHIIWLSREGLLMLEEFILPMVERFVELKVLAYKLRASFYHIFVLFHNQPAIHSPGILSLPSFKQTLSSHAVSGKAPKRQKSKASLKSDRDSIIGTEEWLANPEIFPTSTATKPVSSAQGPLNQAQNRPPGLAPVQPPKSVSSFLLPAMDYTPTATACFNHATALADRMLPGSHPLRLSVKLEYAAYLYDCLHDSDACRRLAKQAIADVYNAQEGMDDESFEDAAEIVGILGKMVKRGGKTSSVGGGSSTASRTPRGDHSRSEGSRSPSYNKPDTARTTPPSTRGMKPPGATMSGGNVFPPAVPDLTMANLI